MSAVDLYSEIRLTVKQHGKTYEYYFPKVEAGQLNIEPNYPAGYWDYPPTIKGITSCHVDLNFRAVSSQDNILATVKTDPPLSSRRHPPKKRTK